MAIYDYSPTKVELQSLIQFFSGGRCNVTLGGEPSILLRYMDVYKILSVGRLLQQALRRRVLYPAALHGLNLSEIKYPLIYTTLFLEKNQV